MIDWRAVDSVVTGARGVPLTPVEKRMAVRRMAHRLVTNAETNYPPPGKLTADQLGDRVGLVSRHVHRVRSELPEATERLCPLCGCQAWILTDGVVEPHPDSLMEQCPLSGYELAAQSVEDFAVLAVSWLAGWWRQDPHGVVEFLDARSDGQRLRLLIAAIAAVGEGGPEEIADRVAA